VIWDCPKQKGKKKGKPILIRQCLKWQEEGECDKIDCKHKIPAEDSENAPTIEKPKTRRG